MGFGFKHGTSVGGDLLNFTVVSSTTEPSSPKENTLWVNTSWALNCWTFGPELPLRKSRNENFVTYPYASGTNTSYGVTFTDNGDGTVTVNGTATGDVYFRASRASAEEGMFLLPAGEYTMSGCPSGGSENTYMLQLILLSSDLKEAGRVEEYGSGADLTVTEDTLCRMNFHIKPGTTVRDLNVYFQVTKRRPLGIGASEGFEKGSANGQLWFKPDHNSTVSFEALKKNSKNNSIVLQPGEVYRFRETHGWEKLTGKCKIYQNGAWKDVEVSEVPWDGYYFRDGEQYTDVTGGWTSNGWSNTGTVTVGTTIALSGSSSTTAKIATANTVDLTDAKKIWFDSPNGANGQAYGGYLAVTRSKSIATAEVVAIAAINRAGTGSVDVSGLSGKYYICLYASGSGLAYADVRAVWME